MATGFQGKFHRERCIGRFVKELVRRSHARCELCEKGGVQLMAFEVTPLLEEPAPDRCVFVCDACLKSLRRPEKAMPAHWRCLNHAIWSEVPVVQVVSIRLLRRLARGGERWAEELVEQAWLDPETEAWADEAEG